MKRIPLFKPYISWRARWYALRVLMGDMIGEGPMVKRFEQEFSNKFGLTQGIAVNSGTAALELAYELAGIGEGDEVITTVLTCTATNIPLLHRKAKIVFADIDPDLNIDVEDVRMKITDKTKAIIFTHFGGNNRGLDELQDLVNRSNHKMVLIEDAAQAVGSLNWGKADYTAVSFQAIKTLTTVDGGMLFCGESEDREKARRLRWYGYDRPLKQKNGDTDLVEAGYKYQTNDLAAAIGLGNLRSLHRPLAHRKKLAEVYKQYGIKCHSWLAVGFLHQGSAMDAFRLHMALAGIEVGQHHFDNRKYSIFKEFPAICPLMDEISDRYVFLPYHTGVSVRDAHRIGALYQQFR